MSRPITTIALLLRANYEPGDDNSLRIEMTLSRLWPAPYLPLPAYQVVMFNQWRGGTAIPAVLVPCWTDMGARIAAWVLEFYAARVWSWAEPTSVEYRQVSTYCNEATP